MDERESQQRVWDLERLLWDAVDCADDPDGRGYQSAGVTKIAELLAGYEQRITELEKRLSVEPKAEE